MEIKIDNKSIEEIAKQHIGVAIADVLNKQSHFLIKDIVHKAMHETTRDSYGRETIIQASINAVIREEAKAAVTQWLDEKRPEIRKEIYGALAKTKTGLLSKIVDNITASLSDKLTVAVIVGRE